MKHLEKKLPGFSIIYLHNPYKCSKCLLRKNIRQNKPDKKPMLVKRETSKDLSKTVTMPLKTVKLQIHRLPSDLDFMYSVPVVYPPLKTVKKILKKKNLSCDNSKSFKPSPTFSKKNDCVPAKFSPKLLKKNSSERDTKFGSVKKQPSKSGGKVPGKGTLKRKRWFIQMLNRKNDNYEDDLFEHQKFGHFQSLLEDESDNAEKYEELKTPVFPFSLSPRATTPSPSFNDCYNPTLLSTARKGAEEYQYRRMKRRKGTPQKKDEAANAEPKETTENVLERLEKVATLLNTHQNQQEKSSDNEDDSYFSDLNSSCHP